MHTAQVIPSKPARFHVPTSLTDLAEQHDRHIRAFLSKVTTLQPSDMDDAVQDVYLRFAAHDLLTRYKPDKSGFQTYLFLVCASVAKNRHRSASRRAKWFSPEHQEDTSSFAALFSEAATQLQQVFVSELRAFVALHHPTLVPVLTQLEETGRVRPKEASALRAAVTTWAQVPA